MNANVVNPVARKLALRARILTLVREFFGRHKVLEVETPLLSHATNPAPYLHSFCCEGLYLQTSPEFAMKRLLASGSGDIYQICKAFRKEEAGRLHNPEFTILEWYRLGFDQHKLMDETNALLQYTINAPAAERLTYAEVFSHYLNIDPHSSTVAQLQAVATEHKLSIVPPPADSDTWLQLLFSHLIEPHLGLEAPIFIYDFPAAQAMLAKVREETPKVASRFEVYFKGLELANGFQELTDAAEQRARFQQDLAKRQELGLPAVAIDENFLAALPRLPECAGIALGVDRLLLLAGEVTSLEEVLCYPFAVA